MRYTANFVCLTMLALSLVGCTQNNHDSAAAEEGVKTDHLATSQIKCQRVEKRNIAPSVHCTGQIKPIFGKEYIVSARLAGRVLKISVAPGDHVKPGQILGYVDSQQIGEIEAEAIRAASRLSIANAHEERELRVYQEDLIRPKALIVAKTAHQQAAVSARAAERNFKRLESLHKEGIAAEKDYLQAKSALEKANLDLEQSVLEENREERLFANKALIKKNWQLAHAETQTCQNELETIKERLKFLGVDPETVGSSILKKHLHPLIPITALGEGTVVQQFVSSGEMVNPDEPIFSICDLRKVAISCELPESELSLVTTGLPVEVAVNSYADKTFSGVIAYVGSRLDPKTRTIPVRAEIDNCGRLLKLNMFAAVNIVGRKKEVIACPRDALHESGGKTVVYVRTAPEQFARREVSTGVTSGELIEICSGLESGEEVVTAGGVLVKTKLLMGNRGDG